MSCSKTKIGDGGYPVYPPIAESRTVTSDWITMNFEEMTNDDGTTYLQASTLIDGVTNADRSSHIDFGYTRFDDAGAISFQRIPFNISNANENLDVSYNLDNGVFTVRIDNASTTGQTLSADRFQDVRFRLLMVSSTDYASMQCDWDDYSSVENALGVLQSARANSN